MLRVLVCIAHDPGVRLRDIAATLGITERRAYGIVTDLTEAGYVVKEKDGRRHRYQIQAHLPLREVVGRDRTMGEAAPTPPAGRCKAPQTTAREEHACDRLAPSLSE